MYRPNLTFVALPIPEIIGGTSKIWGVPGFAHAFYSPKFLGLLFAWTLPNLKFVALPVPEIIGGTVKKLGRPWIRPRSLFSKLFMGLCSATFAVRSFSRSIAVLGWGCEPQILGKGRPYVVVDGTVRNSVGDFL